mgnify:CR=1 FL=1
MFVSGEVLADIECSSKPGRHRMRLPAMPKDY